MVERKTKKSDVEPNEKPEVKKERLPDEPITSPGSKARAMIYRKITGK